MNLSLSCSILLLASCLCCCRVADCHTLLPKTSLLLGVRFGSARASFWAESSRLTVPFACSGLSALICAPLITTYTSLPSKCEHPQHLTHPLPALPSLLRAQSAAYSYFYRTAIKPPNRFESKLDSFLDLIFLSVKHVIEWQQQTIGAIFGIHRRNAAH
jgi:hypothetical protein